MKFRTNIRIERRYWEWIKVIYPVYGAKSLSAFIEGVIFFFCYGDNPVGINIRKLLEDALDGKVFIDNPAVMAQEQRKTDFLDFVTESGFETLLLNTLCSDGDNFLQTNKKLVIQLHHEYHEWRGETLTDEELFGLVSIWRDIVKANGKFRTAYANFNVRRYAEYQANKAIAERAADME